MNNHYLSDCLSFLLNMCYVNFQIKMYLIPILGTKNLLK